MSIIKDTLRHVYLQIIYINNNRMTNDLLNLVDDRRINFSYLLDNLIFNTLRNLEITELSGIIEPFS